MSPTVAPTCRCDTPLKTPDGCAKCGKPLKRAMPKPKPTPTRPPLSLDAEARRARLNAQKRAYRQRERATRKRDSSGGLPPCVEGFKRHRYTNGRCQRCGLKLAA